MTGADVSVLLPVRNGAATLPEAIASLRDQTLEALDIVVVDDGSTDQTPGVLSEWAATDDRVRIVTRAAGGIVEALEAGRAEARGRYLARMDADDIAHPERLARQLAFLEARDDLVGCGCLVEYFPPEAVRDGARRYEAWINAAVTSDEIDRALLVECPLAHPTFFMRAEAVDAVGGYRDVGWPEDYDLLLRLRRRGGRFGKVPERLLRWREGEGRLSRTHPRYAPEAFLACKVDHLVRSVLRRPGANASSPHPALARPGPNASDLRDVVIWGAGPVGKAFSRALSAAGVAVVAFVELDPRKIGQEIHGARVLSTDEALELRDAYHLGAVGQEGARGRIEGALEAAGFTVLEDFVAVA